MPQRPAVVPAYQDSPILAAYAIRQFIARNEQRMPLGHPYLEEVYRQYAEVLTKLGRDDEASDYVKRADYFQLHHAQRNFIPQTR